MVVPITPSLQTASQFYIHLRHWGFCMVQTLMETADSLLFVLHFSYCFTLIVTNIFIRILGHVLKHSHPNMYVQLHIRCRLSNFLLAVFNVCILAKVIITRFGSTFTFLILVMSLNYLNHRRYAILYNRLMGQQWRAFRTCLRILWFKICLQH